MEDSTITNRLESAATLLERTLAWLDERQAALAGDIEKISATVEQSRREEELAQKLAAAEREIADLRAAAQQPSPASLNPSRKTLPTSTTDMLAKHGIGDGPVDVRTLDAALAGLSLEQRIAVKSQLLRSGAIG
jgi:septal ring factor EnvC (AmiA/AmiB activator)